jgi:hypothetical protein
MKAFGGTAPLNSVVDVWAATFVLPQVGEPLVLEEHVVVAAVCGCWAKAADKPRAISAMKMATCLDDIWFLFNSGFEDSIEGRIGEQ